MTDIRSTFFARSMLGRKTNMIDQDAVIKQCAKLAYRDMLTAGRFFPLPGIIGDNCNRFIEMLEKANFEYSRKLIDDAKTLFGESEVILGKDNRYATRFGLAQKLVNMTFKYLYVFSNYVDKAIDYSGCDCPLDSVVLAHFPEIKCSWSKISPEEYDECQKMIKERLDHTSPLNDDMESLGNLAFDFDVW